MKQDTSKRMPRATFDARSRTAPVKPREGLNEYQRYVLDEMAEINRIAQERIAARRMILDSASVDSNPLIADELAVRANCIAQRKAAMDSIRPAGGPMNADADVGTSLAPIQRVPAASLVEPLTFPGTPHVFYRFAARPYGQPVLLVKTRECAAAVMAYYKIAMEPLPTSAMGFCSPNETGPIVIGVFKGGAMTLTHECVHAALRILARNGVRSVSVGDEERMAYLCDDLFAAFVPQM